jgi:hypothetical protein
MEINTGALQGIAGAVAMTAYEGAAIGLDMLHEASEPRRRPVPMQGALCHAVGSVLTAAQLQTEEPQYS